MGGRYVGYGCGNKDGKAYLETKTKGAKPVLVLHEVWGFTSHTIETCSKLSEAGYAAVAPLLFWRRRDLFTKKRVREAMDAVWNIPLRDRFEKNKLEGALAKARPSIEVRDLLVTLYDRRFRAGMVRDLVCLLETILRGEAGTAVIGFSFGGGLAFRLAGESRLIRGCIAFSAEPPGIGLVKRISSPMLLLYGGDDSFTTRGVPKFVGDALRYKKDVSVNIYAAAGHEFFDRRNGRGYEGNAAADSWEATRKFLQRVLG